MSKEIEKEYREIVEQLIYSVNEDSKELTDNTLLTAWEKFKKLSEFLNEELKESAKQELHQPQNDNDNIKSLFLTNLLIDWVRKHSDGSTLLQSMIAKLICALSEQKEADTNQWVKPDTMLSSVVHNLAKYGYLTSTNKLPLPNSIKNLSLELQALLKDTRSYYAYIKQIEDGIVEYTKYLSHWIKINFATVKGQDIESFVDSIHHIINILKTMKSEYYTLYYCVNKEFKSPEDIKNDLQKSVEKIILDPQTEKYLIVQALNDSEYEVINSVNEFIKEVLLNIKDSAQEYTLDNLKLVTEFWKIFDKPNYHQSISRCKLLLKLCDKNEYIKYLLKDPERLNKNLSNRIQDLEIVTEGEGLSSTNFKKILKSYNANNERYNLETDQVSSNYITNYVKKIIEDPEKRQEFQNLCNFFKNTTPSRTSDLVQEVFLNIQRSILEKSEDNNNEILRYIQCWEEVFPQHCYESISECKKLLKFCSPETYVNCWRSKKLEGKITKLPVSDLVEVIKDKDLSSSPEVLQRLVELYNAHEKEIDSFKKFSIFEHVKSASQQYILKTKSSLNLDTILSNYTYDTSTSLKKIEELVDFTTIMCECSKLKTEILEENMEWFKNIKEELEPIKASKLDDKKAFTYIEYLVQGLENLLDDHSSSDEENSDESSSDEEDLYANSLNKNNSYQNNNHSSDPLLESDYDLQGESKELNDNS